MTPLSRALRPPRIAACLAAPLFLLAFLLPLDGTRIPIALTIVGLLGIAAGLAGFLVGVRAVTATRPAAEADTQPVTTAEVYAWHRGRFGEPDTALVALKLAEEAGEVAGAVVKRAEGAVRPDKGLTTRAGWTAHLLDEIGDVGIVLHTLCAREGVDLAEVIAARFRGDVSRRAAQEVAPGRPVTATRPDARHDDERSRAEQILCALVRDIQLSLGRYSLLRHFEPSPAVVDRSAGRVLEFFREVARGEARAEAQAVLRELLAELDAEDLATIARNHPPA